MVPMSVEEIAKAVDGRLIGDADSESRATNTVSDSRQAGPGSVFVAIRGERVDGHDFVAKTAEQGATVAIVDHEVKSDGLPQIVVKDTVDALGELARYNIVRRRELDGDFDIIGLTGSVGKTTTKDLLSSLLATVGPTVAPVGSFNNEIGLPLTALRVDEHTRFFVAEMGASHIGEIARLTRIAPPNTAIVLKVGVAHLGEFGSRERIAQAKSEIVQGLLPGGTAVLNADDEHVVPMAGLASGDVLWFGLGSSQEPEVRAIDVTADRSDHAEFTLVDADGNHTPVHLGIPGRHNVMNALAAATVAMRYGMAPETVARILASQHTISPLAWQRHAEARVRVREARHQELQGHAHAAYRRHEVAEVDLGRAWGPPELEEAILRPLDVLPLPAGHVPAYRGVGSGIPLLGDRPVVDPPGRMALLPRHGEVGLEYRVDPPRYPVGRGMRPLLADRRLRRHVLHVRVLPDGVPAEMQLACYVGPRRPIPVHPPDILLLV